MSDATIYSRPTTKIFGCERCLFGHGPHSGDCAFTARRREYERQWDTLSCIPDTHYFFYDRDGGIHIRRRPGAPEPQSFVKI